MRRTLALAWTLAAAAALAQPPGRTPLPVVEKAARGSQCVAPPAQMRRNHMEMLKHQRVDAVRAGARAGQFSLKGCVGCHASRESGSVAQAQGDFCVSCHRYAAVRIDCFECHAARPAGAIPHAPGGPAVPVQFKPAPATGGSQ